MTTSLEDALGRALPGATDHGDGAISFAIYAPGKSSLHVIGSFNDWRMDEPMRDRGGGYWVTSRMLPAGRCEYQFVIDGQMVVCDPYAQEIAAVDDGPPRAVLDVGRGIYRWRHDGWQRPALGDLVLYETHIGDLTPEGTFQAAIGKLDYLADLGINALEVMPLYEGSPGDYWGYQPEYFLAPRRDYGTFGDLVRFVDECHARGMAVILDLVVAHTSPQHPFAQMYPFDQSPWYGRGLGEVNQFGMPTLDYSKPPTNAFVRDVQSYWLRVFHIDGFRYDYLIGIGSDDYGRGVPHLMRAARDIQPDAYLIGEALPEQPELINNSELGACWHGRMPLALETLLCQRDSAAYKRDDFRGAVSAFDPATQDYRAATMMVNYAETHDEQRLAKRLQECCDAQPSATDRAALAITALMTAPGEPMLYHGQEFGQSSPRNLQANKLSWELLDTPAGAGLHEHARRMIRLRHSRASLRNGSFRFAEVDPQRRLAVFHRRRGELDQAAVAMNFSANHQRVAVPLPQGGLWHDFFTGRIYEAGDSIQADLGPWRAAVFLTGVS